MKKLLVVAGMVAVPAIALADPCPKGNNSHLGDTTTASTVQQEQQELDRLASGNGIPDGGQGGLSMRGVRNLFPH